MVLLCRQAINVKSVLRRHCWYRQRVVHPFFAVRCAASTLGKQQTAPICDDAAGPLQNRQAVHFLQTNAC